MTLTVGSLCSGYEGISQGLALAGWDIRLAWVADNDPGAARLLTHRHPEVSNLGDITAVDWAAVEPVDIITAGYPCQPFSDAGLRKAEDDDRHIWPAIADAIRLVRPRYVLLENVRGHVGRGFARVVARLASLGYVGSWVCVRASDVGAPHRRERLFCLATDAARLGHGHPWTPGGEGIPSAAVANGARPGGTGGVGGLLPTPRATRGGSGTETVSLLPTPNAALGRGTGFPSEETAQGRFDRGTRCLDDAVALLPTPMARDGDGRGEGGPRYWARRRDQLERGNGLPLGVVVNLLPTPTAADITGPGRSGREGGANLRTEVALLPTPRATDGTNGGPNQRGSSGDLMLPSAVMLLPTPTAADGERVSATYERGNPTLIGALLPTPRVAASRTSAGAATGRSRSSPSLEQAVEIAEGVLPRELSGWDEAPDSWQPTEHGGRWGQYAPAIARWEQVLGRPAPDPTEPGTKGQPRLSPRFVEWMQGLPEGWVTAVPGLTRNDQLRLLGNGVLPLQCAAALRHLATTLPRLARGAAA
jgi:DNA (cytosine-5)-methyltransferase 1